MLNKLESRNGNGAGDSSNGQLLRDIEEISKALYLPKTSSNEARSKSAGRLRLSESKSNLNPRLLRETLSLKDKKSSSIWNWKKPLKALTHIGSKRIYCCFYLHVHSIEGLPSVFNNLSLCVHWKRKNEAIQTTTSRVSQGMAEFDETLMHRCSVYSSNGGPNHPVKYESKLLLLYASVVEAPGLDIGKQWVDLTSFLPRTMEELEGEKSRVKWTTSFNLSGKAKGASLNVSFGFWVMKDKLVKLSGDSYYPELLNLSQNRSSMMDGGVDLVPRNYNRALPRVGSISSTVNYGSDFLYQSLDMKVCHEVLLRTGLELSKSINCLYQKLDEDNLCISTEGDSQQLEQHKPTLDFDFVSSKEMEDDDCEIPEFSITEVGTEMSENEQLACDQGADHSIDGPAIETINVDEIIKGCDTDLYAEDEKSMNCIDEVQWDVRKDVTHNKCTNGLIKEEVKSDCSSQLIPVSAGLDQIDFGQFTGRESHREVKSNYKTNRSVKRSLSLDDAAESVATDFLNMLGVDDVSCITNSDGEPESPRELLWRQFEKETLASGNFFLDFDAKQEESEFGCSIAPEFSCPDFSEESELSLIVQDSEEEHKRVSELLKRRKAKILEDLETEALMQEWGLNEEDFRNSPRTCSGGFGSPIELPPQERHQLPPVEEGFGPYVRMKNGGFLWSMNPLLFRKAKNSGSLIIQVSNPVVLPAKMGCDVMKILQHLALVGVDKLYLQINRLMPLEDITGKTIKQVARCAAPSSMAPQREVLSQHDYVGRKGVDGVQSGWHHNDLRSGFIGDEIPLEFLSLEDLSPLVVNKIEALILEGLRVQSRMSDEVSPSCIYPQFTGKSAHGGMSEFRTSGVGALNLWDVRDSGNNIDDLVDLSMTLKEWLRVDAGNIGDEIEDINSQQILKILAAHNARCIDLDSGSLKQDFNLHEVSGRKCGLLGNDLTIAHLLQLRDPFRNYEPVGVPILLLIQVQRVFLHFMQEEHTVVLKSGDEKEQDQPVLEEVRGEKKEMVKQDEGSSHFRIIGVHLAGVDTVPGNEQLWGTTTQWQSGSRWLLASGLGRSVGNTSKSKAIVKSSPLGITKLQPGDILWSISSNVQELGATLNDLVTPHTRNPDVIFQTETIRP
ncbi:EEIG1/EHBP1 N-terminal domain containing protein [Trema orientale]|uniref:EEIG1/EHBP1 N-terminal domain containing protein n=1 Tax=Trema orientale TaxID=63057 RepID=A0A2P5FDV8_TREOI|nr:EEIG1/EHBP1 N-terminal domain containing protein [Trema orientale]